MKQRDYASTSALKSKLEHDTHTFTRLRNKVMKESREAKADFFIKIIGDAGGSTTLRHGDHETGKQAELDV